MAALVIVYAALNKVVLEAVIAFCFGGIIPGTNKVLAPDIMIMIATIGLGIILEIVLMSWFSRIIDTRHAAYKLYYAPAVAPVSSKKTSPKKSKRQSERRTN